MWVGHDAARLGAPDAVVISSAICERNTELRARASAAYPVWARAQVLAAAGAGRRIIAVAGTHGKTTTTSMLAVILERAGLDPTFVIGGDLNESGSGARAGDGELFVAEADESDGSFLLPHAAIGVVTNVEVDHVDFYPGGARGDRGGVRRVHAIDRTAVVACGDDPGARGGGARRASTSVATYGTGTGNDLRVDVGSAGPGGARGVSQPGDGARSRLRSRWTARTTS